MKAGDEVWLKVTVNEVSDGIVEFYHHDYCVSIDERYLLTDEEVLEELKKPVTASLSEVERLADIRNEFGHGDWEKIKANFVPDYEEETFERFWAESVGASDLLRGAFIWTDSPEGWAYWKKVNDNLLK